MKWLNLDLIKAHCRIEPDFHDEDLLLAGYGEEAEEIVLKVCNRTMEEIIDRYGKVPAPLVQASLLLVAMSYEHREAISQQNLYIVPYAIDMRVKPYMKLT